MNTTFEKFGLRARLPEFRTRLSESERIIAQALEKMRSPLVAFSAGKDSSVVLHLVRAQAPETRAAWGDEEWNLPETLVLVNTTPNLIRTAFPDEHAEFFKVWQDTAPPGGTILIDRTQYTEWDYQRKLIGNDGTFLGLRMEENSKRRLHLKRRGALFFCERHGVWECNPIAQWTVEDVWTYIMSRNVPYNAAYDKLAEMGVELKAMRVGPLAQERVLGYGQLVLLKRGWLDLFNRFAEKYPEVRSYT